MFRETKTYGGRKRFKYMIFDARTWDDKYVIRTCFAVSSDAALQKFRSMGLHHVCKESLYCIGDDNVICE